MKKSLVLFVVLAAFLVGESTFADALPVVGKWKTIDDEDGKEKSVVELYEQGGKIYGKIASLRDPLDKDGKPKVCTKCEGADKDKPVIGLVIIKGLSLDDDEYSGGTIMDPNNGKTYKCKLKATDGGAKLNVRGFIGFSLIGRTQTWLKK
ncbi:MULTISPECIES: DUF2147 domain-containing protein [Leptospira]|uniref:DUF2147 domain-containing protein n=2 Tax=Leptospira TaxID=171 RepID=A0A4Z1ANS4_9LEPT|nr:MULTISPECIES: DUF2147 domain-containing protein [Leptospira]PKA14495.1 hypothetical protein CH363_18475 [Leptospira haakeii]PKA18427.1 hypothetical protein CH377_17850 [Leptospira haakeii]TGM95162.1 DUF2147 domain-containing protein [Leptospira dzoumogneensis]